LNANLLKSKMVLKEMTTEAISKEMDITKSTFYKKLRGTTEFTRAEILTIAKVLELRDKDIMNIFFEN